MCNDATPVRCKILCLSFPRELHKNVKWVMEVIVGLLRDRVDVEREPAMERQVRESFCISHKI